MPDDDATRVATLFDSLADTYDNVGVDFFRPIAASLCRAMAPEPGERWWDVGCGRGAVIEQIATAIGPEGAITGSDISSAMLDQAQALAERHGWSNVTFVRDDAQAPEHAPQQVDVISSCLVLFFLPRPAEAVAAWAPSLRPGGRIGITTFGTLDPAWSRVDEVFEPFLPPALRDARTSGARGPFASDAGMEELLASAGLGDVRTVRDEVAVRFADPDHWHAFTWSTGQRAMWLAVPEDQRPAVRRAAEERLAEATGPDGAITFRQAIRHTLARGAMPKD